ncbi:MAG: PAS domain S-box protein [Gemmatimonadetes bacterium]|nr:PAS domain S-box protein [Gemmatimonadota bacterium]
MALQLTGRTERFQAVLDQRRLLRWIYLGRVAVATASFGATLLGSLFVDPVSTFVATALFVTAMALTAISFVRTEVNRRTPGEGFLYAQFVHDLVLITSVVHLTGGGDSQFSALYILVMAAAALLLPIGSSLLLAMLGSVLYVGDAFLVSGGDLSPYLVLQLVVFTLVAVGTGYIAARLQEAGEGRQRLQAELARMQLRAADILANIRAGIITVDDAGRLLYANPAAATLLGLPVDEAVGTPVLERIRAASPGVLEALTAHIAGGVATSRREGVLLSGGRAVPLGITTTSVSGDLREEGRATTAIFQDITDVKQLEAANLRAQRLEAVAELSASLAHEIKNPLASIQSAVEQLSHRASATPDERTLSSLIVRESERLSRLLSEFLDFARVQVLRRDTLDLRTLVRGAAALAGTHPDRGAQAGLVLDLPDAEVRLDADEDLLHRAVFNLILNAFQASPPEGEVRVRLRTLAPGEQPLGLPFRGTAHAIEVRDSGPGIAPEIADRLFEPFATTKPGGSGLGLAMVHRAIEAHQGVILVDSTSNGTGFTVLLPVDPTPSGIAP